MDIEAMIKKIVQDIRDKQAQEAEMMSKMTDGQIKDYLYDLERKDEAIRESMDNPKRLQDVLDNWEVVRTSNGDWERSNRDD